MTHYSTRLHDYIEVGNHEPARMAAEREAREGECPRPRNLKGEWWRLTPQGWRRVSEIEAEEQEQRS